MADGDASNGTKIARLEQQYIQLLESKIAALSSSTAHGAQQQVQSDNNGVKTKVRVF